MDSKQLDAKGAKTAAAREEQQLQQFEKSYPEERMLRWPAIESETPYRIRGHRLSLDVPPQVLRLRLPVGSSRRQ